MVAFFPRVHARQGRQPDRPPESQDIFTPLYNNQMPPGTGRSHIAQGAGGCQGRDRCRGETPVPEVRRQVHEAHYPDKGRTTCRSSMSSDTAPSRSMARQRLTSAGQARVAALERLRHRPVAQGQQGQREGRTNSGRGGVQAGRGAWRADGPSIRTGASRRAGLRRRSRRLAVRSRPTHRRRGRSPGLTA